MDRTGPLACKRCLMDDSDSGVSIRESGLCGACEQHVPSPRDVESNLDAIDALVDTDDFVLRRSGAAYDCLALLSGGKDSSFMLTRLVERFDWRILALTVDYGFISDVAKRNVQALTDSLGVDHMYLRPSWSFLQPLYASAIRTFGEICIGCEAVLTVGAFYTACTQGIPLLAWGMRSGQFRTEPDAVVPNDAEEWGKIRGRRLGPILEDVGGFPGGVDLGELLSMLRVIDGYATGKRMPYSIFPLLGQIDRSGMLERIQARGWNMPPDVGGFSTNCAANHLHIFIKKRRFSDPQYREYLSGQIREGLVSREQAIQFLEAPADRLAAQGIVDALGMPDDVDRLAIEVKYPRQCLC